jgi:hypothetical protein
MSKQDMSAYLDKMHEDAKQDRLIALAKQGDLGALKQLLLLSERKDNGPNKNIIQALVQGQEVLESSLETWIFGEAF